MANRILRDWTASERIDKLSVNAEVFFTRLIMKVDDYGALYANTRLLRAALFPLRTSIKEENISKWLRECQDVGVIKTYSAAGKDYLQIIDFGQRLDRARAKYPTPEDHDLAGYVYLMQSGDIHKIGFSQNPWARVKEIKSPVNEIVALTMTFKGSKSEEKELHTLLREFNYENEWFKLEGFISVFSTCFDNKNTAKELIVAIRSNRSRAETETESQTETEVKGKGSADAPPPFEGELLVKWFEWEKHRKEKRAALTPTTREKQIKLLGGRPPNEAIEILNYSLDNGYTGLFPKNNRKNGNRNTTQTTPQPTTTIIDPGKDFGIKKGFSRSGVNGR